MVAGVAAVAVVLSVIAVYLRSGGPTHGNLAMLGDSSTAESEEPVRATAIRVDGLEWDAADHKE